MRRTTILILVGLCCLFYNAEVIFAEDSAVFRIITTMPPSAQAGKEIVFEVRITNTGTETWVSAEYSLFIKTHDANKNYLTESDKIRRFKDIDPGEVLTANITFNIPVDYSGTYYYCVGIEFEKEALFSHYFILKILPFTPVPEVKKWTGNIQIGYQDDQAVEPTTSLNLRVVNLLPRGSYLKFSTSGQSTPTINPELSNFLVSYHSKKLDISAGDFTTGLSGLARYLKDISKKCPDEMFLSGKARSSRIKVDFPVRAKRKTNYACRLAGLALVMTKNNRERHEVVQDFMLANDTATLACEVPVYLYRREVGRFQFLKDLGLDFEEGITGHIDVIQIRYGYIHLLDFKPQATKEKHARLELFLYALALSARTGIWLRNFVCGWFDDKDYFEFRPADIVLKLEKIDKGEMRKYIPQF